MSSRRHSNDRRPRAGSPNCGGGSRPKNIWSDVVNTNGDDRSVSSRSTRRRLEMEEIRPGLDSTSNVTTVTPQRKTRTRGSGLIKGIDLLASATTMQRPMAVATVRVVATVHATVSRDIVPDSAPLSALPESPIETGESDDDGEDEMSPLTESPSSPLEPRFTIIKLMDEPIEVRFRIMLSPGKSNVIRFDKQFFYYHADPLDLNIESNANISEIRNNVVEYIKNHKEYVPDDCLCSGSELYIKTKRCVCNLYLLFILSLKLYIILYIQGQLS